MSREDVFAPKCGTFYIGTSAIIGLTFVPGQNYAVIKSVSVGSSGLWMGGITLAVGLSAPSTGYLFTSANEIQAFNLSDTIYFTSAGSTSQVTYILGNSSIGSSVVSF